MSDNTQDAAEPSLASAGSQGDGTPLFSQRNAMARKAVEWCDAAGAVVCPLNIVTALFSLGLVVTKPTLTDAERESLEWAEDAANTRRAAAIRGLLKRLG